MEGVEGRMEGVEGRGDGGVCKNSTILIYCVTIFGGQATSCVLMGSLTCQTSCERVWYYCISRLVP